MNNEKTITHTDVTKAITLSMGTRDRLTKQKLAYWSEYHRYAENDPARPHLYLIYENTRLAIADINRTIHSLNWLNDHPDSVNQQRDLP